MQSSAPVAEPGPAAGELYLQGNPPLKVPGNSAVLPVGALRFQKFPWHPKDVRPRVYSWVLAPEPSS